MTIQLAKRRWVTLSSAVLLICLPLTAAQSQLATGAAAEITEDGLHRVAPEVLENAWIKPDLNLSGYSKVFLLPSRVQFREVEPVSVFDRTRGGVDAFPIPDQRRTQLIELWGQLLRDDLAGLDSFELVGELGRDVLLIRGDLVDFISGVPSDEVAGSGNITVMYPWAAGIMLEIRDSMSDELLARTFDRRRVEGQLDVTAVWARTSNMIQRWSQLLCDRLEALGTLASL